MATYEVCIKIPQLINSLHKIRFFQLNEKNVDFHVGDMTFQIPDGTPLYVLNSIGMYLRNYVCTASISEFTLKIF